MPNVTLSHSNALHDPVVPEIAAHDHLAHGHSLAHNITSRLMLVDTNDPVTLDHVMHKPATHGRVLHDPVAPEYIQSTIRAC